MSPLFFKKRGDKAPRAKRELPWHIRFTGRLLAVQSLGFVALSFFTAPEPPVAAHEFNELWLAASYLALAFFSAWAGLGMLRLRSSSWNLAMLLEGAALLHALYLYTQGGPFYIYIQMFVGILVVLNLNQPSLRRSFPTELIEAPLEINEEKPA